MSKTFVWKKDFCIPLSCAERCEKEKEEKSLANATVAEEKESQLQKKNST